uniref:Uncharacterized protein AlNc14C15G1689 n=1 Tax=Albugo laibachii Nc14 TaxID=890382 RepID=F0W3Z0_9STRA|nr:conserved hypothetical protein [Albugo laibachii Nc14]|eukprot:CCA15785.1 conserved hypothetical protein [Albugo laibachii Nc14]
MTGKQSPMRIFMMLPMIYLMGKIDFENMLILNSARIAFFSVQIISLLLGLYIRHLIKVKNDRQSIFVPGATSPLDATPNYDQMNETTYFEHENAKVNDFLKQTCIGALISSVIHFKFGVNQVVVIQSLMAPMNLYDNPLVKKYIFRSANIRFWNELLQGETPQQAKEALDDRTAASSTEKVSLKELGPAEAITKTFSLEENADYDALWEAVKDDLNAKTSEDGWTALMVACSSPVDTSQFIKQMVTHGADVLATDNDGWTALHWSAFHARPESAETLLKVSSTDVIKELIEIKATDGRTAESIAEEEGNNEIVDICRAARDRVNAGSTELEEDTSGDTTLRQRKNAPVNSEMNNVD